MTLPNLSSGATETTTPPGSWSRPHDHYLEAIAHPWYRGVVRLQDALTRATSVFWSARGVRNLHLPMTTGSISSPMGLGSDSSPVSVEIGGTQTYLADSMQFMLEYGIRLSPKGTYYVMPSFRGEDSDASHLSQFFHSEAEIPGGFDDVTAVVDDYLRALVRELLAEESDVLEEIGHGTAHLEAMLAKPAFNQITFAEAIDIVGDTPDMVEHRDVASGSCRSLTRTAEQRIMSELGDFTWVTQMDHLSVPFYQAFADPDLSTALCGDLLFGVGETVGAGERHTTAEDVRTALRLHGVPESTYLWYIRMREMHPIQTAGFGMGVERFFLWALQHDDIRDLALLIRTNGMDVLP